MITYLILLFSLLISQLFRHGTKYLFFILALMLIAVASLRHNVGTDYNTYAEMVGYAENLSWIEPGYRWINSLFFDLHLPEWSILTFFSIITLPIYLRFINRYSSNPLFSLLLFFLLGYYFISFNAVRQIFSMALLLFAMQYWREGNIKFSIFITMLAGMFHYSVFMAIPVYLLSLLNYQRIFYIALFFASLIISLSGLADKIPLMLTSPDNIENPFLSRSMTAAFKVLAPTIFIFYLIKFEKQFIKNNSVEFNLFFFATCLSIMFYGINYFIRINYYFEIWLIILLPSFLKTRRPRPKFYWGILFVIYFVALFWGNFMILNGHNALPYSTLFEMPT